MNVKNLLLAGLVGGITNFLLGWLVWGVLMKNFFDKEVGTATGVSREEDMIFWALIISSLAFGMLFALIFERWARISTFTSGALAGAAIGALMVIFSDFLIYGSTNMVSLDGIMVDILLSIITASVVGGVVGWMLGRGKELELTN